MTKAPGDQTVIAVDVANGLTRIGVFSRGMLVATQERSTPRHLTADEARAHLRMLLGQTMDDEPNGAILSSVVPSHSDAWIRALEDAVPTRPLVVGPGLKTGLRMGLDNPAEVGSDRVANVVAARHDYGTPVVVVSFGTTTNIEVVDESGTFVGGAIAPGLMLGMRSLSEAAARLPMVELRAPRSVTGKSTREAIQAGVVLGEASRVDGLLDLVEEQLGGPVTVVTTGHHAAIVSDLLRHEVVSDSALTLRGLAHIWYAHA